MSTILPSIMCLKSVTNKKFLRYRTEDVASHGLLQFSGDKFTDPLAQFDVLPSASGDGLVHLKSRYTNKFLVRWAPTANWISASANDANEDQSNWACTLFRPSTVHDDSTKIRLFHVQLGHHANLSPDAAPFDSCLYVSSTTNDGDVFIVVDWTSAMKLPRIVAFKGDNSKYLGPVNIGGREYLQFAYNYPNDPKVAHEVTNLPDGTITIKSKSNGKFWRLGTDDWILADVNEPVIGDSSSLFRVNVIDVNEVALLNMDKTWYCKRYTVGLPLQHLLSSILPFVDEFGILEVIEVGL